MICLELVKIQFLQRKGPNFSQKFDNIPTTVPTVILMLMQPTGHCCVEPPVMIEVKVGFKVVAGLAVVAGLGVVGCWVVAGAAVVDRKGNCDSLYIYHASHD